MDGIPHGGCWWKGCKVCFPDAQGRGVMSPLEEAEAALTLFEASMDGGTPRMANTLFVKNPGLDRHILSALHEFVRVQRVAEQAKPARRVSLSDDPKELVDHERDAGLADPIRQA